MHAEPLGGYADYELVADVAADDARGFGRLQVEAIAESQIGGAEAQIGGEKVLEVDEAARPGAVAEAAVVAEPYFVVELVVVGREECAEQVERGLAA